MSDNDRPISLHLDFSEAQDEIFFPEVRTKYNAIPKGRRSGGTRGASHACIIWAHQGMPILWGDTVYQLINAYVHRMFIPALKKASKDDPIKWKWEPKHNLLLIGDHGGYIDFRSADNPENWEGQGYRRIVLNEAGIIMSNRKLIEDTVLPMLMDFEDSELYAIGTPKGKRLRNGTKHPFYELAEAGLNGMPNHRTVTITSYQNPFISKAAIEENHQKTKASNPGLERQNIYGEFIDKLSNNPFTFAFDEDTHKGPTIRRPNDYVYFSIDFNVDPFVGIAAHIWKDAAGWHFHRIAESRLKTASIESMAEWMLTVCPKVHLMKITGDRNGLNQSIGDKGPIRLFTKLVEKLRASKNQLKVLPNPTHLLSREEVNFVFSSILIDNKIDPLCVNLLADHANVEVDAEGKIIKGKRTDRDQRADYLDCDRYMINTYLRPWFNIYKRS